MRFFILSLFLVGTIEAALDAPSFVSFGTKSDAKPATAATIYAFFVNHATNGDAKGIIVTFPTGTTIAADSVTTLDHVTTKANCLLNKDLAAEANTNIPGGAAHTAGLTGSDTTTVVTPTSDATNGTAKVLITIAGTLKTTECYRVTVTKAKLANCDKTGKVALYTDDAATAGIKEGTSTQWSPYHMCKPCADVGTVGTDGTTTGIAKPATAKEIAVDGYCFCGNVVGGATKSICGDSAKKQTCVRTPKAGGTATTMDADDTYACASVADPSAATATLHLMFTTIITAISIRKLVA